MAGAVPVEIKRVTGSFFDNLFLEETWEDDQIHSRLIPSIAGLVHVLIDWEVLLMHTDQQFGILDLAAGLKTHSKKVI